MKDFSKNFLEDVEACPELLHNLQIMDGIVEKQKAEIAAREKLIREGADAYRTVFQKIGKIEDADVLLLLSAKALLGMPWEMLRTSTGGDARAACAAWLDEHAGEV